MAYIDHVNTVMHVIDFSDNADYYFWLEGCHYENYKNRKIDYISNILENIQKEQIACFDKMPFSFIDAFLRLDARNEIKFASIIVTNSYNREPFKHEKETS